MDYTVFKVYGEYFGIPVLTVQEISRTMNSYPIPGQDSRIAGLVNLRGNAVAVIDMRKALFPDFDHEPPAQRPKMIVLESMDSLATEAAAMGISAYRDPILLLVDEMHRIIPLEAEAVEPAPAHLNEAFVDGVIKDDDKLITMLSIPRLIETINTAVGV